MLALSLPQTHKHSQTHTHTHSFLFSCVLSAAEDHTIVSQNRDWCCTTLLAGKALLLLHTVIKHKPWPAATTQMVAFSVPLFFLSLSFFDVAEFKKRKPTTNDTIVRTGEQKVTTVKAHAAGKPAYPKSSRNFPLFFVVPFRSFRRAAREKTQQNRFKIGRAHV